MRNARHFRIVGFPERLLDLRAEPGVMLDHLTLAADFGAHEHPQQLGYRAVLSSGDLGKIRLQPIVKTKGEGGMGHGVLRCVTPPIQCNTHELLKRLQLEGSATPADVLITTDAGRLHRAKEAGVLRKIDSDAVDRAVPERFRDADGFWVGLSQRARTIIYARDRVEAADLSTYEGLVDSKWKGRMCVRSSGNIYNQSLVASMIETVGAERAEAWARGLVGNFARPPAGGDTDQMRAVAAGQCDVAIANTYYFGRLVASTREEDRQVAAGLRLFWPNQEAGDRGVHVNVSGAGITAHARRRDNAIRLLEYLVAPDSQVWYAEVNHEYPVVDGVPVSETLRSFGEFKADTLNLTRLGVLMDRAGWR